MLCGLATHRQHFLRVGVPDETWAARRILKDYCTGQLLHCELPEGAEGGVSRFFKGFFQVLQREMLTCLSRKKGLLGHNCRIQREKNEPGQHHVEYQGRTSLFQKRHMIHSQRLCVPVKLRAFVRPGIAHGKTGRVRFRLQRPG